MAMTSRAAYSSTNTPHSAQPTAASARATSPPGSARLGEHDQQEDDSQGAHQRGEALLKLLGQLLAPGLRRFLGRAHGRSGGRPVEQRLRTPPLCRVRRRGRRRLQELQAHRVGRGTGLAGQHGPRHQFVGLQRVVDVHLHRPLPRPGPTGAPDPALAAVRRVGAGREDLVEQTGQAFPTSRVVLGPCRTTVIVAAVPALDVRRARSVCRPPATGGTVRTRTTRRRPARATAPRAGVAAGPGRAVRTAARSRAVRGTARASTCSRAGKRSSRSLSSSRKKHVGRGAIPVDEHDVAVRLHVEHARGDGQHRRDAAAGRDEAVAPRTFRVLRRPIPAIRRPSQRRGGAGRPTWCCPTCPASLPGQERPHRAMSALSSCGGMLSGRVPRAAAVSLRRRAAASRS